MLRYAARGGKMTAPALERIAISLQQIDEWVISGSVPGAAVAVWWNGSLVAERYVGEARRHQPVDERTLFALASVTKPVVATALLRLVERDLIGPEQLVVELVPEFAAPSSSGPFDNARDSVTIRQLLSHTSGLPEDLPRGTFAHQPMPTLDMMTDAMCALPLVYEPGTELIYSNAGFGILGRLVERATNRPCWDVVWNEVLDPLALRDTTAQPGPACDERTAHVADPTAEGTETESFNSAWWRDLGLPWAGLYGSAADLTRFAAAFLPSGPSLLDSSLTEAAITDQVGDRSGAIQSMRVVWPAASWGLGWEVKGRKRNHWTGELTSPKTFCHFGAAGTLLWADPERDLAVAIFGNRTVRSLWPFRPARWGRLSNALIAAVDR
jgi:beta-lactamase class C